MPSAIPTEPFNANDTLNATFTALAGVAGKYLNIQHLTISLNTADTITVQRGSTTIFGPHYLPANGGLDLVVFPCRLRLGAGEALNITKGSASTHVTASGFYTEE